MKNLLIKIIFIFILLYLFINIPNVFATVNIPSSSFSTANDYESIPTLTIPSVRSFVTLVGVDGNSAVCLIPYELNDYIALSTSTNVQSNTYCRVSGYNVSSNSLTDMYEYVCTYSNGSWSSWSMSAISSSSQYAPNSDSFNITSQFNCVPFVSGIGVIGNSIISSGVKLPDTITLNDNILIIRNSQHSNIFYLVYSSNKNNYFATLATSYMNCFTPAGSNSSFDVYTYNSTTKTFDLTSSNVNQFYSTRGNIMYSYNNPKLYTPASGMQFYNYGYRNFFATGFNTSPNPVIDNSIEIPNWSFDNLILNFNSVEPTAPEGILGDFNSTLFITYNNNTYQYNIDNYKNISDNNLFYYIPKSILLDGVELKSNSSISFSVVSGFRSILTEYDLGSYVLNVDVVGGGSGTTEPTEPDYSGKLDDLLAGQQQTTDAVGSLENTITDGSVDDTSIFLPSDNTNDITADGLNGIFTTMYNAFCSGEAKDIVFPIPYTDKNITLSANYVRQMLSNSGASWVITIIEAFWWYLISRFIIKDVANKISKIKSGNIESIENSNIKEEML